MEEKIDIKYEWLSIEHGLESCRIWLRNSFEMVFDSPTLIVLSEDQQGLRVESERYRGDRNSKLVYVAPGRTAVFEPHAFQHYAVMSLTNHMEQWLNIGSMDLTSVGHQIIAFIQNRQHQAFSSMLLQPIEQELDRKKQILPMQVPITLAQKVMQRIHQDQRTSISISRIAMDLSSHPSLVSRTFSKEYGISPVRYSHLFRLAQAKRSLRHGNGSLKASEEFLFADQSHFVRSFRKQYGMTPRDYQILCSRTISIRDAKTLFSSGASPS